MASVRWVVLGSWLVLVAGFPGCGSSPMEPAGDPAGAGPASTGASASGTAAPWKVRLTIDGVEGRPDPSGLYCVYAEPVSTHPLVSFSLAEDLGPFHSAVVTLREVVGDVVALDGIFISDFAAAEKYKLRPDHPFLLLNPGPGVIVGQGEAVDIRRLKPGTTYQLDLVVQGRNGHASLPARFTTR